MELHACKLQMVISRKPNLAKQRMSEAKSALICIVSP